jgi:HD-GYP domain-containing protein (c-di-GMP phosphodiesterase class II)
VLTVWAPTDKESGLEDLKKSIQQKLQAVPAFAKAKPTWAAAQGLPDGGLEWSVLAFAGKQPFVQVKEDKPVTADLEGETEIWLASDAAMRIAAVLAWRVPETAKASVPVAELAPLVARKVELRAAAEPAAAGDAPPAK